MAGNRSLLEAEFAGMDDDDDFDPEEDFVSPGSLIVNKEVMDLEGRTSVIEAHITHTPEAEDGITWVKVYDSVNPSNFSHFYVDTMNPELILTALERYLEAGKFREVVTFIRDEGKTVRSPVEFRLRLETSLGGMPMAGDAANCDLF